MQERGGPDRDAHGFKFAELSDQIQNPKSKIQNPDNFFRFAIFRSSGFLSIRGAGGRLLNVLQSLGFTGPKDKEVI